MEIRGQQKTFEDFLDWDVAVEHHKGSPKKCVNCTGSIIKDSDGWEYIKCHGYTSAFSGKKVFTINIHY